jgi:hypothetical protein
VIAILKQGQCLDDNDSSSEDSNEISDCNSEAIRSNSDGTERSSSIAASTGTILVGGMVIAQDLVEVMLLMNQMKMIWTTNHLCQLQIPFI